MIDVNKIEILRAEYIDKNHRFVDLTIKYEDGTIHPYGVALDVDDQAPVHIYLKSKIESGDLTPDSYKPPSKESIAEEVRIIRNRKLKKTDHLLTIPDYPITEVQREELKKYRQQLRDITKQSGFPENVAWPTEPDFIK